MIAERPVPVHPDDTAAALQERVQASERDCSTPLAALITGPERRAPQHEAARTPSNTPTTCVACTGGDSPGSLRAGPTVDWTDFETAIPLGGAAKLVQVEGLDSSGKVIGRWRVVAAKG